MRDYYFLLRNELAQPVKARDLATAARYMETRHPRGILCVHSPESWAQLEKDRASMDLPRIRALAPVIARSAQYGGY